MPLSVGAVVSAGAFRVLGARDRSKVLAKASSAAFPVWVSPVVAFITTITTTESPVSVNTRELFCPTAMRTSVPAVVT